MPGAAHRSPTRGLGAACVVRVTDVVSSAVSARGGRQYHSPPHPREQALVLVDLLLGCPVGAIAEGEETGWTRAIAGGQRTVTLTGA